MVEIETTTTDTYSSTTLESLRQKTGEHETLIKYLLIGIVSSIVLLAANLYQDKLMSERLSDFATEAANSRMKISEDQNSYQKSTTDLEKNFELFKQCLKLGGWKECFN